jgi:hypothetical protein
MRKSRQRQIHFNLGSTGAMCAKEISMRSKIHSVVCTVMFVFTVVISILTKDAFGQTPICNYYASPSGGGNGLSQSSPFRIANFWSVAGPGKTLCLLDGIYQGASSMIIPTDGLNGATGSPITIRALNDGEAIIDGQDSNQTVELCNNDYFVIQGIDAHNSSGPTIYSHCGSANNAFKRVVAWQAGDGNWGLWMFNSNNNTLCEDCAGFGRGRNIWQITQSGNNATLRRVWGMFERQDTNTGPEGVVEGIYNSSGLIMENLIGTWADSVKSLQPYGILLPGHGSGGSGPSVYGSILYLKSSAAFPASTLYWQDTVASNATLKDVVAYTEQSSKRPFELRSSSGNLMQNTTEIGGVASSVGSGWAVSNRVDVATVGAAPNIWNGSGNQGARVCYQYINGSLTSTPLWPWPMDARIRQALTRAGKNPDTIFGGPGNSVTQQMEQIFGPIPSACRTGSQVPGSLAAPTNLAVTQP